MGLIANSSIDFTRRVDVADLEQELIRWKSEEVEKFIEDALGLFGLQVAYKQTIEPALEDQKFILEGMLLSNSHLQEVSFVNLRDGFEMSRKIRDQKDEPKLRNQVNKRKFQEAKAGKVYLGRVSYTTEGSEVEISSPVRNQNGVVIAVLSGVLDLSPIQKAVGSARLGNQGYLYLIDNQGRVAAHALKPEAIGEDLSDFEIVSSVLGGVIRTGREDSDLYLSPWDEKVIGAGAPIRKIGWAAIVEWPEEDALLPIKDLQREVIIISLIVFLIVMGLATFVALGISRPIEMLKKGVRAIGKGEFDYRIEIKTQDELQELGDAFNKMAKGLKRLEELKDEFVFIAAHELRAPVTAIRGYISMIMAGDTGPISPKMKEYLSPVEKSGEALNKLVEDLLQVARSEAGRIEIKVKPTDMVAQIKSVFEQLKILADEKSIKMIYQPPKGLPKILADPDKLGEVIKNLVDNAIKYTLGAGTVTVTHEIKEKMLITHVKDTGAGIPKDRQEKLFQKFYRVKSEGTEEITGTGLGLWIIKQLLGKMNGKIWFESEKDKGSTFSFSLPVAQKS